MSAQGDGEVMLSLFDEYSRDIMGGGEELSAYTKENLVTELCKRPTAHVFIASSDSTPVGLAICFEGFSTFACKPLMNIQDLCVAPAHRRQGVCSTLIFYVEQFALTIGCCKLTLEVLEGNHAAKAAYRSAGFEAYELDPESGTAEYWQKPLLETDKHADKRLRGV